MCDDVVSREPSCLPCFLQRDLRCQNGTWIAERDENFCVREPSENHVDVITVGRSFFDPARDCVLRAVESGRVRVDHEHQQFFLGVCRIQCRALKPLEKFLPWKCRVIALAPFARAAEQHVGK